MGYRNFCNFLLSLSIICILFWVFPPLYAIFVGISTLLAVIRISEYLMTITRKYFLRQKVSSEGKAVLITGCDSGFGHEIAKRMDSLGYHVFAACLNPEGEGGRNLTEQCSSRLRVLQLDVTDSQSVESVKKYVIRNLGKNILWAVLNNAGIALPGEVDWTPMEDLERVYEVNAAGTLRVTKAFLPLLRCCKGRLVNNASACGEFICPGFVGYCMSKSAAIALTTGLRIEMMKWGVKVISIQPFFYKTPLTNENTGIEMAQEVWSRARRHTQLAYGDAYLNNFLRSTRQVLQRSSSRVDEVLDCFEDALTAEEPLSTYMPAYFPDKLGIKLLKYLPTFVGDHYLRYQLERGHIPEMVRMIGNKDRPTNMDEVFERIDSAIAQNIIPAEARFEWLE